jgi:hypothetical protein
MHEKNIDNFITAELNTLSIRSISVADELIANENHQQILSGQYSEDSQIIVNYLTTLRRLESMFRFKFRRLRLRAFKF